MNTPTPTIDLILPVTIDAPAPVRLRDALTLADDASDEEVAAELESLPRAAACAGCRHAPDSDGRGHFACSTYHPAWDIAEEIGLADAALGDTGWTWMT